MLDSIVTFHRAFVETLPPMRGDKSGLGALPAAAFQYCEPVRSASAFGWHVFPPLDIALKWNGSEVFVKSDRDEWGILGSLGLGREFDEYWDAYAPPDLKRMRLPYLSSLFVPGVVQLWSGLFVSTKANWSILVRPLANVRQSSMYQCYEGLIETDTFKPCPLFINIRLLTTGKPIVFSRRTPLFQVQPIHRSCYAEETMKYVEYEGLRPRLDGLAGMSRADWGGLKATTRSIQAELEGKRLGNYAVGSRRRRKQD